MTKKRQVTFNGFTNNSLKRTNLFGGGILPLDRGLEGYNELEVNFCAASRRKECDKKGQCERQAPDSIHAKLRMVEKKSWDELTKADEAKIKVIIQKAYKKCEAVTVIVSKGN